VILNVSKFRNTLGRAALGEWQPKTSCELPLAVGLGWGRRAGACFFFGGVWVGLVVVNFCAKKYGAAGGRGGWGLA
jgi:hypothetical protein